MVPALRLQLRGTDPIMQGTVVELSSGQLLMLLRSSSGCTWRSVSPDKGYTWSEPQPTRIPNPNSKVHAIRLEPSGHLVLAFNNHKKQGAHMSQVENSDDFQCR
mmetsp:Transcript_28583/g.68104  ORF Transcript_28583/g.68104 Transcript_28583/m.68104 type:complete len:104 (+) Transcript_28583:91-402(+)